MDEKKAMTAPVPASRGFCPEDLYGRWVTAWEVHTTEAVLDQFPGIERLPAIQKTARGWRCHRCGNQTASQFQPNFCCCRQEQCVYCLACAQFGILRSCDTLYHLPNPQANPWARPSSYLTWRGQRSPEQERAALEVVESFRTHRNHLIWAVTGAGKTEMIYPVVATALSAGQRVGIAAPRLDVCNELYPRFQKAFSGVAIALLHSQSQLPYAYGPLVICSTHQLVRFDGAFDLLIIDEIDAFPFHNDPLLQWASQRAVARTGSQVWLTATPNRQLQRQSVSGQLATSLLPARYHRHPLPEPQHCLAFGWQQDIQRGRCPKALLKLITRWIKEPTRFLLFMPNIRLMRQLETLLHRYFPDQHFTSVSAEDDERVTKVEKMRQAQYDFLLTTTILERGVTFRAIHVAVLGSERPVFTTAALVQISGRVGRSPEAPTGEVVFLHEGRTRASVGALKQIRRMNDVARKKQLLD